MSRFRLFWTISWILILGSTLLVSPVQAQGNPCPGLVIDDTQSEIDLNVSAICEASQVWIQHGLQVYVFLTDARPPSRSAWYDILNTFEAGQNILDISKDLYSDTAITFAASTMPNNTVAGTVDVPASLKRTPLWDDTTRELLRGRFINRLAAGDFTRAITLTMADSYQTAFPPPPPTLVPSITPLPTNTLPPSATPLPTATIAPVVATQQAAATQAAIVAVENRQKAEAAAQEAQREETITLAKNLLIGIAILIGLAALTIIVIIPAIQREQINRRFRRQILLIRQRSNTLILLLNNLFEGKTIEGTKLYQVWDAYDGGKYPQKDKEVRSLIALALPVYNQLAVRFQELVENSTASLETLTEQWEKLYLTIVGNTPEILRMTQAEQIEFLNPLTVITREVISNELLKQISEPISHEGDDTLQIGLLLVNPEMVNAQGVLGYAAQIKAAIAELDQARQDAEPALAAAKADTEALRQKVKWNAKFLTADQGLVYPATQFELAEKAKTDGRWLDVVEISNQILRFVKGLEPLLGLFYSASEQSSQDLAAVAELETAGYKLDKIHPMVDEARADLETFKTALAVGDLAKAKEFIGEIEADAQHALDQASALQVQYARNMSQLEVLARTVAQSQTFADKAAEALTLLKRYPQSNWGGVDKMFESAQATLATLSDNPADATDISSQIQRQNALDGAQDFAGAAEALDRAFAQVQEANRQLQTVIDQLAQVQEIEKAVADAYEAAGNDYTRALSRRDADNAKIGTEVDSWISQVKGNLLKAKQAIQNREFMLAADLLKETRQIANQAYEFAGKQVSAINTALTQLKDARAQAELTIQNALQLNSSLPETAQESRIASTIAQAQQALEKAKQQEQKISGLEDTLWLTALSQGVSLYGVSLRLASQAISEIQDAERKYKRAYQETEDAIQEADATIRSAKGIVNDSDAGLAGSSSLNRAISLLPQLDRYGVGYDSLRRIRENAEAASNAAAKAASEARSHIQQVEDARAQAARERQRKIDEQAAQNRKAAEARAEKQRESDREEASRRNRMTGFSDNDSNRTTSFSSNNNNRSSGMGEHRR